ncbi:MULTISPECIES: kynureninase [unclassified Sporosarcina]|uniref:kynureninase n=1 Tax=unclassified Sporosarcina TaxID=2647733 RepID=UPI000C170D3B|nr:MULTISPECIES: kynureninase [unclassified Sporosarcina]PID04972.1 kynureninase [Sporosarcina sp. P30]PID08231.1 kynureninase [Sporosarcina sp. P31]PID11311.1 kynureninase [Sporosarcina sp. P32b]
MSSTTLEYAKVLDQQDSLAPYREEFYLPLEKIYMDGNSLGLLSKRAEKKLFELLDTWKTLAIDGWTEGTHPWYYMTEQIGGRMAPLVGGKKSEVIATGSTTTNLHQMISTFYRPSGKRTKILADELNFPSDIYALQSQIRIQGLDPDEHLIRVKSDDGLTLDESRIIGAMTEDVALIVLPSVLYRSGQVLDMQTLTREARERGIPIGFDLSHSVGSVTHALHEWDVDFAFWCTYKHLNGGPGSVGGLFVNERHFGKEAGLAGWFGSDKNKQFDMHHTMTPATDAGAYQIGTPHILSLAPLLGSLEMFEEIGMEEIRQKSLELTSFMLSCIKNELGEYSFGIGNPLDDSRGGHLLLQHKEAARICQALKAQGVVPDFRAPDGIRLAPVALYNSFEDVWQTIQVLKNIMQEDIYKQFPNERGVVA